MAQKKIVHIVGTGTIGEPLIGILSTFREQFGIDEVTFHKRTPLITDRSKVIVSCSQGAKLCVDKESWHKFVDMGMEPSLEAEEAIERASVIIDCTPVSLTVSVIANIRISRQPRREPIRRMINQLRNLPAS